MSAGGELKTECDLSSVCSRGEHELNENGSDSLWGTASSTKHSIITANYRLIAPYTCTFATNIKGPLCKN